MENTIFTQSIIANAKRTAQNMYSDYKKFKKLEKAYLEAKESLEMQGAYIKLKTGYDVFEIIKPTVTQVMYNGKAINKTVFEFVDPTNNSNPLSNCELEYSAFDDVNEEIIEEHEKLLNEVAAGNILLINSKNI